MKKITEMTKKEYKDYIDNREKKEIDYYKERISHWLELDFSRAMLDSLSKSHLSILYGSIKKSVKEHQRMTDRIKELQNKKG